MELGEILGLGCGPFVGDEVEPAFLSTSPLAPTVRIEGCAVGFTVGVRVGIFVGATVGCCVGTFVGATVGCCVGTFEGANVGA